MSNENNQDETSGFVCESEDNFEVEATTQEVDVEDGQAIPETTNTEAGASDDVEANQNIDTNADTNNTSIDKKKSDLPGADAAAENKPAKKAKGFQKRINEVVTEREKVKRENENLQRQLDELKGKKPEGDKGDKEELGKEPIESEFNTYDEYLDALDEFDKQSADNKNTGKEDLTEKKGNKSEVEDDLTDSQKTALALTQERVDSAEKPDDFDTVALNPDLPLTGEMIEALSECDDPAKVMYHLGKNVKVATEIAGKTAVQQAREIAKLDLTVTAKPGKPANVTNAPDVISTVAGTDSQKKSHSEMSFAEFEADDRARNKGRNSTW
jgi:hypothetical protein